MARQMTQDDRRRIDALLAAGRSISEIAADLGRNKTTILHEIIARAVPCDRGYGCSNRICARFDASGAEANRQGLLHESRRGIHPDEAQVAAMNAVLSPCTFRGQSIRNVIANNPNAFKGVAERTVYDYVADGLFDIRRGELPEACRRRPRRLCTGISGFRPAARRLFRYFASISVRRRAAAFGISRKPDARQSLAPTLSRKPEIPTPRNTGT